MSSPIAINSSQINRVITIQDLKDRVRREAPYIEDINGIFKRISKNTKPFDVMVLPTNDFLKKCVKGFKLENHNKRMEEYTKEQEKENNSEQSSSTSTTTTLQPESQNQITLEEQLPPSTSTLPPPSDTEPQLPPQELEPVLGPEHQIKPIYIDNEDSIWRKLLACIPLIGIVVSRANDRSLKAKYNDDDNISNDRRVKLITIMNHYKIASIVRSVFTIALSVSAVALGTIAGIAVIATVTTIKVICIAKYSFEIYRNRQIISRMQVEM